MPKVVDNYVFQRKIGKGQYGDVFKGFNKQDNTDIAIKAIRRQSIKGKFLQLLQNEIKVLRTCDNKNIIKLYDIKKTANNFYLILQYCNEGDLSKYVKTKTTLPEKQSIQFFIQILNAFKTLVKHKIMHRDFKLANILLHDGQIKIADFGFSKLLTQQQVTDTMLGSPLNMAPQVLGQTPYNSKADIWSMGVVFYQMLFGVPPFQAKNMVELVNLIKKRPVKFPRQINNISDVTEDVLRRMLTVDPQKRIDWQDLFVHPINKYLQDKLQKQMSESMMQTVDVQLNASKFYLKTNMIVEHPKQINKNQNVNQFAYQKISKKNTYDVVEAVPEISKKNSIKQKNQIKQNLKQTQYTQNPKQVVGDQETIRQKQIKAFKRNSKYLLHRRNIYVFLASVAEQAMELGKQMKFSDIVGYLLIRKLLQLLSKLKQIMQSKQSQMLSFWQLFQSQKDFKDIKVYVWKQYDVFRVFYQSVHNKVKDKVKNLDQQIQAVISNHKSPLNQKIYQKYLRDYLKSFFDYIKQKTFNSQQQQRKYYIHLQRIMDCLNLQDVFLFQKNGNIFNFHQFYQDPMKLDILQLRKDVAKRIGYI